MKIENQHTEWKESWRTEYIQWVCAFANSKGGKLIIGKDDKGNTVGVAKEKKLSEDIPNQIIQKMGIVAEVNIKEENSLYFIEIIVPPYPNAISYEGKYYIRTGSTKQLLTGESLTQFLLSRTQVKWEEVPQEKILLQDYDRSSVKRFLELAKEANRLNIPVNDSLRLFDRFKLLTDDGRVNRAGYLLFFDSPQEFILGAYIKIAYFESETNIVFQDIVEGSLFFQFDRAIDLLTTKYVFNTIEIEGLSGKEVSPYSIRALREALMNAIAHRDYSKANPIQIKVFKDKLIIFNEGSIPLDWNESVLLGTHNSKPRNPIIAEVLYHAGYIERWGIGIKTIIEESEKFGTGRPTFDFSFNDFKLTLFAKEQGQVKKGIVIEPFKPSFSDIMDSAFWLRDDILSIAPAKPLSAQEKAEFTTISSRFHVKSLDLIVRLGGQVLKRKELLDLVSLSNQTFNFQNVISPLLENGLIEYTIKDRIKSPSQRYRLTNKGTRYGMFLGDVLRHIGHDEE